MRVAVTADKPTTANRNERRERPDDPDRKLEILSRDAGDAAVPNPRSSSNALRISRLLKNDFLPSNAHYMLIG